MIAVAVIALAAIGTFVTILTIIVTRQQRTASQSIDIIAMSRHALPPVQQIELRRWTRDASLTLESILRDDEMIPSLHERRRKEIQDLIDRYRGDE